MLPFEILSIPKILHLAKYFTCLQHRTDIAGAGARLGPARQRQGGRPWQRRLNKRNGALLFNWNGMEWNGYDH